MTHAEKNTIDLDDSDEKGKSSSDSEMDMDKLNISDSEDEFPVYKKSENPQSSINGQKPEP